MASYQGGKQQIGKQLHQAMTDIETLMYPNKKLQYFEPFMGFCGVLKHFASEYDRKCYATDLNPDIVAMWRAIQNGWKPDGRCSRQKWNRLKESKPTPERTLYGHCCSFGGQFFNYYLSNRDYAKSASKSVQKIASCLDNVSIHNAASYSKFNPKNRLVYCDPPYANNKQQNGYFQRFDHDKFWKTMRRWSKNNLVFVSEYEAPDDFICIWEKKRNVKCTKTDTHRTEKLFVHKSIFKKLEKYLQPNN